MKNMILIIAFFWSLLWAAEKSQNTFYEYPLHDLSHGYSLDTLLWPRVQKKFRLKKEVETTGPQYDISAFKEKKYTINSIENPTMHSGLYGSSGFFNWYTSSIGADFALLFQIEHENSNGILHSDFIWAYAHFSTNNKAILCKLKTPTPFSFIIPKGSELLNTQFQIELSSGLELEKTTIIPHKLILISKADNNEINIQLSAHLEKLQNKYTPEERQKFENLFIQQQIIPVKEEMFTVSNKTPSNGDLADVRRHKTVQGSIHFQANIFQALINDATAIDYNTKVIPATGGATIGNEKIQFVVGAGAYRKQLFLIDDSLSTVVDSLQPLIQKVFNVHFGVRNTVYENKRFSLNYVNLFAIYSIKEEQIEAEVDNSSINFSIKDERETNIELFSGFEPHFKIANRFSLFTRSGVSLLWLHHERNSFRIAPRALYGGIGMSFNF